jgi:hypothetical protein
MTETRSLESWFTAIFGDTDASFAASRTPIDLQYSTNIMVALAE